MGRTSGKRVAGLRRAKLRPAAAPAEAANSCFKIRCGVDACDIDFHSGRGPQPSGRACFRAARDCSPRPGAVADCRSYRTEFAATHSATNSGCEGSQLLAVERTFRRPRPEDASLNVAFCVMNERFRMGPQPEAACERPA